MGDRAPNIFLALGLAGCEPAGGESAPPEPTPAPSQCMVDARELGVLRGELDEITAELEMGTPEDTRHAITRMAVLLEHAAFRTRDGRPAVEISTDPRAFVDWWARGGDSWVKTRLSPSTTIVESPPGVRAVVDPDAVPAEIVCERADCDPLASRFVDTVVTWGLRFEGYERRRCFYGESTGANAHQHACTTSDASAWLDCVSGWRSAQAELPLGDYRFPTTGWLFAELGGMLEAECPTYFGMNLETGEMISASDCKIRRGRGSALRFREFTLVTVLSDQIEEISEWQRLRAPEGLDLSGTCSLDSTPPSHKIQTSAHARLYFWWWSGGSVLAEGMGKPTSFEEPASGLAVKLLHMAEYTVVAGEASLPDHVRAPDDDRRLSALLATLGSTG